MDGLFRLVQILTVFSKSMCYTLKGNFSPMQTAGGNIAFSSVYFLLVFCGSVLEKWPFRALFPNLTSANCFWKVRENKGGA